MSSHVPVLLKEVLHYSAGPMSSPKTGWDATFGRGGHTLALLRGFPELKMLATDRDMDALKEGRLICQEQIQAGRLETIQGDFASLSKTLAQKFDLILADLGVSSPQLDRAERGFSFYHDGPLDMRMDASQGETAADIVNTWEEEDLTDLFKKLGEIRRPGRVIYRILEARKVQPFQTTGQLANLIADVEGWRKRGHHPATSYFLALRIFVNQEIQQVQEALSYFVQRLAPGGRLLIITFHSAEDRVVKWGLKGLLDHGFFVEKKVVQPSREEEIANPRSRSAKLRIFERYR